MGNGCSTSKNQSVQNAVVKFKNGAVDTKNSAKTIENSDSRNKLTKSDHSDYTSIVDKEKAFEIQIAFHEDAVEAPGLLNESLKIVHHSEGEINLW